MKNLATPLQSAIADAHASATPLRIVGSGTWLDAGRPVVAIEQLSTRELSGVVEYVPGDLVISVHAGTTLEEIAHETARHGQWLALDPYASQEGIDAGTIGATIATASQGPLSLGHGRARDLILGLSFITGDGTVVRGGGRVVKNVAGFDLVRLATGAWGTLGVISQVSLRLHARPAIDETFAIALHLPEASDAREAALSRIVQQLNGSPTYATTSSLAALVLLTHDMPNAVRSRHSLPAASCSLLARAPGNRARVDAQRAVLSELGELAIVDPAVWRTVRSLDTGNATLRISDAPMRAAGTTRRLDDWLATHGAQQPHVIIEPLRGLVRISCTLPDAIGVSWSLPDRAIAERLPAQAWSAVPCAVSDRISAQLRRQFDPARILNPGILGEPTAAQRVDSQHERTSMRAPA